MRVAVVTESYLPQVNGVSNSVLHVSQHLAQRGIEVLVVAPGAGPTRTPSGAAVIRTPSVPLPGYPDFRLSRPWAGLATVLDRFHPDVVHLASPTVLGAQAATLAARMEIPTVAIYQTDLAGFAARYGLSGLERMAWRWLRRVHATAGRTLAPSRHSVTELRRHGLSRVARWARGVDLNRFSPSHRSTELRARLAPDGDVIVGYVGRLAREKQVDLLAHLDGLPQVRLVIVGSGPQEAALRRALPRATFLGSQHGADLATTFASLDVFVHTGAHETFCQAAQEALASGLPVVAPAAGGLLDLVEPGRTGLLFEPGCGTGLRAQVATLARAPHDRREMSMAARESVVGRGWDVIGEQLVRHYREVLAA